LETLPRIGSNGNFSLGQVLWKFPNEAAATGKFDKSCSWLNFWMKLHEEIQLMEIMRKSQLDLTQLIISWYWNQAVESKEIDSTSWFACNRKVSTNFIGQQVFN